MGSEGQIPPIENRETFLARLKPFSTSERSLVMKAYDFSKVAHANAVRQGGKRYFEHPREASLIMMDECQLYDANLLAGLLLHDVAEDRPIFGNPIGKTYDEWRTLVRDSIGINFNDEVAGIVVDVTKPPELLADIDDGNQSLEIYYGNLQDASPKAILVKMFDRLHNLRSLSDTPIEKQKRKVAETREHYYPIFEKIRDTYPREVEYLLSQMEIAIGNLHID